MLEDDDSSVTVYPVAEQLMAFGWEDQVPQATSVSVMDPRHVFPTTLPRALRERTDWREIQLPAQLLHLLPEAQLAHLRDLTVEDRDARYPENGVAPTLPSPLPHLDRLVMNCDWKGTEVPPRLTDLRVDVRKVVHGKELIRRAKVERFVLTDAPVKLLELVNLERLQTLELRHVKVDAQVLSRFQGIARVELWKPGSLKNVEALANLISLKSVHLGYIHTLEDISTLLALPRLGAVSMVAIADKTGACYRTLLELKARGVKLDIVG